MTTFGLAESINGDGYEYVSVDDASRVVPNIDMVSPSNLNLQAVDSGYSGAPLVQAESSFSDVHGMDGPDSDYPLIATQQQSQDPPINYNPELEGHLVGSLISASTQNQFALYKTKNDQRWSIGRHPTNDIVLNGPRLSNFHCTLHWNGQTGRRSEITLEDRSTNGTWINQTYLRSGQKSILRGGAAISFGTCPPDGDSQYIFRDVEGQSTRHANQIWSKYDISHELGHGAFARVHKCMERATGTEFAVKIIDKSKLRQSNAQEQAVVREISILTHLTEFHHSHIVSMCEFFEEDDAIYLILELVRGGDLLTYLGKNGALEESEVRRMAAQMCHAIAYVHSQGVAHRDLKPENIMVTNSNPPDCKVADFGLAKLVDDQTFLKTMCGTPAYLAPEVVLRLDAQQAYDDRVDSWSLGIIFYCMLTNNAPFEVQYNPKATHAENRHYFGTRKINWDRLNISEDGWDFLTKLLADDPRRRERVTSMLDHPWISTLVPSESRIFRFPPDSPTPTTTDGGTVAFNQSLQNLNLSDIPIPGLNTVNPPSEVADASTVFPKTAPNRESFQSEVSVTAKIPGAYPKPSDKGKTHLAVVDESESWNLVGSPAPAADPSNGQTITATGGVKRKSDLIDGSSPLTSLSSEDQDSEVSASESRKAPMRRTVPRRGKGKDKSAETPASPVKRRGRPPASATKRGARNEETATRKSVRHHHPGKVARLV